MFLLSCILTANISNIISENLFLPCDPSSSIIIVFKKISVSKILLSSLERTFSNSLSGEIASKKINREIDISFAQIPNYFAIYTRFLDGFNVLNEYTKHINQRIPPGFTI